MCEAFDCCQNKTHSLYPDTFVGANHSDSSIPNGGIDMSLVGLFPCVNGLIVFSDTRCRKVSPTGKVSFVDDERKIHIVPGTSICVTLTGDNRFGPGQDITMGDIIEEIDASTLEDVTGKLITRLIQEQPLVRSLIGVAAVKRIDGCHYADIVTIETSPPRNLSVKRELVPTNGYARLHGVNWAVAIADEIKLGTLHTLDAESAVVDLMSIVMNVSEVLPEDSRVLGGDIELVTITLGKNGKYEAMRSRYRR